MERNEMRNKALGIPVKQNTSNDDFQQRSSEKENRKKELSSISMRKKSVDSPKKQNNELVVRANNSNSSNSISSTSRTPIKTVSSKKEDADVAVEINIRSMQNIQVIKITIFLLKMK
jgi:hypothetical protein